MVEQPFSNAPVSRFYYNSRQHAEALTRLMYGAYSMKGLSLLTGTIGSGKTTIARRMIDSLPEDKFEAALLVIVHSEIEAGWLLRRIALQLGVSSPSDEKLTLLGQLYQRLVQIYEEGKKAVVLIDEAQMLRNSDVMSEFRGLLNLEVPEQKLISLAFFGLPEMEQNIRLDPPLAQRVALRVKMEPFDLESTESYIKHRLRLAGAKRMYFSPESIECIYSASRGIPRVVNTICDNALFEAFLRRTPLIQKELIERVRDNLDILITAVDLPSAGEWQG